MDPRNDGLSNKPQSSVGSIEIALSIRNRPGGGLEIALLRRVRDSVSTINVWVITNHAITHTMLEDMVAAVNSAMLDHFLVNSGVQLILHD
jgi:hypothetical protein